MLALSPLLLELLLFVGMPGEPGRPEDVLGIPGLGLELELEEALGIPEDELLLDEALGMLGDELELEEELELELLELLELDEELELELL